MTPFTLGPIQEAWLTSLENNPERQHTGSLGIKTADGYKACCLGEGGLIAGVCVFDEWGAVVTFDDKHFSLDGGMECYKALGLRGEYGDHKNNDYDNSLASLNDNGRTWPEIAAIIRAKPENYFNKAV